MFSKISFVAFVLPLIHALTLETPSQVTSGGSTTIKWTSSAGDPTTGSIYLVNEVFHNNFAIANNVNLATGTLTLDIPIVPPGAGYTVEIVDISNVGNVFATSGGFSIGEQTNSTTTTSSSTGTSLTSLTSTSSGTISTTKPPLTTSGFGTTVAGASTSAAAPANSGVSSGTATPNSASPLNLGFTSSNMGSLAVAILSAIAGATVIAL